MPHKSSTVLTFVLVLLILAFTVWLLHSGKETAGLLAVVTALVPVLTLLLRPKKDDDTDDAD